MERKGGEGQPKRKKGGIEGQGRRKDCSGVGGGGALLGWVEGEVFLLRGGGFYGRGAASDRPVADDNSSVSMTVGGSN